MKKINTIMTRRVFIGSLGVVITTFIFSQKLLAQFIPFAFFKKKSVAAPGQQAYLSPGTYSWTVPAGVTSVCVVCVGGGGGGASDAGTAAGTIGGGGGGGGTAYKNNISVTPGQVISISVGAGGGLNTAGGASSFNSAFSGAGGGGASGTSGGSGGSMSGSYTAGYSGGGGGTNSANDYQYGGSAGGAVNNSAGTGNPGYGASIISLPGDGSYGYGGRGGSEYFSSPSSDGGAGAVRIIWGIGRSYPSTNTANV